MKRLWRKMQFWTPGNRALLRAGEACGLSPHPTDESPKRFRERCRYTLQTTLMPRLEEQLRVCAQIPQDVRALAEFERIEFDWPAPCKCETRLVNEPCPVHGYTDIGIGGPWR